MEAAFYTYTIIFMLICIAASTASILSYAIAQNRVYALTAIAFLLYFFDLSFIFRTEYLGHGAMVAATDFYTIDTPVLKAFIALGILEALWMAICWYLEEKRTALIAGPAVVFVIAEAFIIFLIESGPMQQWLFYSMREVFLAFCIGYVAVRHFSSASSVSIKAKTGKHRRLLIASAILVACIVAENTFTILIWTPSEQTMRSLLPIYITERNFSENMLTLLLAVAMIAHAVRLFRIHSKHPPTPTDEDQKKFTETTLVLYCDKRNLTKREADVLRCIVAGKDYQNTANELHLAIGTVKSHTHNIFKKAGVNTREDLIRDFWNG